jgi:DNA (cytosine-5)-methyltransferase 1
MITHGSLFSGIGGFDLAARNCGITNVFQVEIDEFCQKVLNKHFPETIKYKDIYEFDGKEYRGRVDIISGGFPCQPFSVAGLRKGAEDERALFPEMLRVISEVEPSWVIAENVYGIITIDDGRYFEEVLTSLEAIGYEVQPFIIPASSVNAPHKRDRVWIVANRIGENRGETTTSQNTDSRRGRWETGIREYDVGGMQSEEQNNNSQQTNQILTQNTNGIRGRSERSRQILGCESSETQTQRPDCESWFIGDTKSTGQQGGTHRQRQEQYGRTSSGSSWYEVATRLCRVDDGVSDRVHRLRALGNAIVPQIAEIIFNSIIKIKEQK